MTAREAYELRVKVARAEDDVAEVRYRLDYKTDGNAEYDAAVANLHKLEGLLAAANAEFGGTVYRVPDYKYGDLLAKVEKIARRARKLDVGTATVREVDRETVENTTGRRVTPDGMVLAREYVFVVLAGEAPVLAGWRFLATVDHLGEGGNLVKRVPGRGEEVDLTEFRTVEPRCDHCGYARHRKDTFVVEYVETGELKLVGRNCLADFLGGHDPHRAAKYAEYLTVLADDLADGEGDDDFGSYGMRSKFTAIPTRAYLTHVALMIRLNGWTARSAARFDGRATADVALDNLYAMAEEATSRGVRLWVEPEAEDAARADAALLWAREELPKRERLSDFDHNLLTVAKLDWLPKKGEGILAYVVVAHARALEHEVKLAERAKKTENSDYVGKVGDRLTLRLTVEAIFENEGNYGTTYITKLLDGDGNAFTWFGSYELERGGVYEAKWTVKKHEEFRGVKGTVLTRPSKLEKVGESEGRAAENERVERARVEREKFDAEYRAVGEARRAVEALNDSLITAFSDLAVAGDERASMLLDRAMPTGRLVRALKERDEALTERYRREFR